MNSVFEENQKTMEYLLTKNSNLYGLNFKDNILYYKDRTIDLKDLNVKLIIMHNPYDRLATDLKEDKVDARTFFDIIKINTFKIEEEEPKSNKLINYALELLNSELKENSNNYDIISTNHYFRLVNKKNSISNSELAKIDKYEKYVEELMQYVSPEDADDYLLFEQRNLVIPYMSKCDELIEKGIENDVTTKYQEIEANVKNEKINLIKEKNRLERKAGFANATLVIILILITGILMGFCGYFFI